MRAETAELKTKAQGREACCAHHVADAYNAFAELLDEARVEAAEMKRLYRRAAATEDPRVMAALNEMKEKLRALEYHLPRVEEGVDRLQGILAWFDANVDRVFALAQERVEEASG